MRRLSVVADKQEVTASRFMFHHLVFCCSPVLPRILPVRLHTDRLRVMWSTEAGSLCLPRSNCRSSSFDQFIRLIDWLIRPELRTQQSVDSECGVLNTGSSQLQVRGSVCDVTGECRHSYRMLTTVSFVLSYKLTTQGNTYAEGQFKIALRSDNDGQIKNTASLPGHGSARAPSAGMFHDVRWWCVAQVMIDLNFRPEEYFQFSVTVWLGGRKRSVQFWIEIIC